ncbi:unnamed protein product, partial [marine sediment metagenome]
TPFLKRFAYTHCEASGLESGRNLERPLPWDLNYPCKPRGKGNRESFLGILDFIQIGNGDPELVAMYLLYCDELQKQEMPKLVAAPLEDSIDEIINVLIQHFNQSRGQGKSRLPVLALYAIYSRLIKEVSRYKGAKKRLSISFSPGFAWIIEIPRQGTL